MREGLKKTSTLLNKDIMQCCTYCIAMKTAGQSVSPRFAGFLVHESTSNKPGCFTKKLALRQSQNHFWEPQFKGNYFLPNAVIPSLKLVRLVFCIVLRPKSAKSRVNKSS